MDNQDGVIKAQLYKNMRTDALKYVLEQKSIIISEIILISGEHIREGANKKLVITNHQVDYIAKEGWIAVKRNAFTGTMGGRNKEKTFVLNIDNIATIIYRNDELEDRNEPS